MALPGRLQGGPARIFGADAIAIINCDLQFPSAFSGTLHAQ